jgi:sugar lactone lactonase YvrE
MQTNLNHPRFPLRSSATGFWGALFAVLTICLCAATASAVPNSNAIVVSQLTWLNALQGIGSEAGSGGALASANAAGTNFGINSSGDIIISNTYGNQILLFNGQSGVVSVLGTFGPGNASGVAVDSKDNLYVAGLYTNNIAKVPYVNGAYVSGISSFSNTTPACTGSDTTVCLFSTHLTDSANGYYFGVVSMAFDPAGNFFFSLTNGNTEPNAILECTVACLSTGTPSPSLVYQEPTSATPSTTGQLNVGSMAFDPWGDLFFTDSALSTAGSNESVTSNLNELVYAKGAYATKPTVIQTLTNATPASYNDELDAVAVDSNGTVYYATQFDGVWAYPNNSGAVDTAGLYGISNQGAKMLSVNAKGELFVVAYSALINTGGSDTLARLTVNSLSAPSSPVGTPSTATFVTIMDNNGAGCTTPPVITFTAAETGTASTEFAAAITAPTGKATTTCATQAAGSDFPVTVTFTPTAVGERVAVLSATDGTNAGSATSSSVGLGPLVTLDPGVWTSYTSGFTTPESISIDGLGNLAIADSTGNAVFEIVAGATVPVSIGTGFSSPDATAFDADGNLFIADAGNHQIVEIPNVAGVLVPASQSVLVSDTVTFGGAALTTPSGLAFGPHGVLYIADLGGGAGEGRVLTYNPTNGVAAVRVSGLSFPWGIAVDAPGTLYVAETGGGDVKVYQGGGVVTTLTPEGITAPWGVAVDASGSVLISDKASGNIVRVPNVAGTLNAAGAVTVEVNPKSAYGLALDAAGDLYSTDGTGAAAYAVQRTPSTVKFGTV